MVNNGKNSHFFRVILPHHIIKAGTLELPREFVKEYGKRLCMYGRLKVPTGSESEIQLNMCNGRAWLHTGWPDFVDKYSIKCGYFLVFKYEGRSRFNVMIFDLSTSEIEYPVSSARTGSHEARECKLIQIEGSSNPVTQGRAVGATSARERVIERAKAFESRNPHFIVIMQPVNVSRHFLHIPAGPGRSYFLENENCNISLKVADGRVWYVKYSIGLPPRKRVRICSGWYKFVRENQLCQGDVCIFELVSRATSLAFKVTVFRIADEQGDKKEPLRMADGALLRMTTAPTRGATRKGRVNKGGLHAALKKQGLDAVPNAMDRILKRRGSFMIFISPSYISHKPNVHIPNAHLRRYMKGDKDDEDLVILHGSNGKTWPVKVKYRSFIRNSGVTKASFTRGWQEFAWGNNLRVGDICTFEMIPHKDMAYKVTIFTGIS